MLELFAVYTERQSVCLIFSLAEFLVTFTQSVQLVLFC